MYLGHTSGLKLFQLCVELKTDFLKSGKSYFLGGEFAARLKTDFTKKKIGKGNIET